MVYIPVRKCWYSVKIIFLLMLVLCLLSLFEKWRGGKRTAGAQETEYEKEIREDEARIIPGLGEGGRSIFLQDEKERQLGAESEKKLGMNVYISDRMPYNRTLNDFRNPSCRRLVYDAELPSASVIIIFHNEPYSVVLRTIWTVLNSVRREQPWYSKANFIEKSTGRKMNLGYKDQPANSPYLYIKEIILVDDCSTLPELKGKLSYYIKTRLPHDMIRILRLPAREGLMLARTRGAKTARGDVLVFLDAHCEPIADWLRPLLQRLTEKRDVALTPVIDVIDQSTFKIEAAEQLQVGGFTFTGHFTWIDVPEREKIRRGSDIAPTWTPTMAGGLFAINRAYYWELGGYDAMMGGWGGENLEMSFRVWMCGGTLETIPCSRVGHVFRSFHPYGLPASSDTHGINTARMADVWMDEYAELYYLHRPDLRKSPKIGDVTHRKILREKLHCKSFRWYLDNIYPEKFVPVRDVIAYGRFRNKFTNVCLDNLQRTTVGAALGVYPCHPSLQLSQYFSVSLAGQLRDEERCAEVAHEGSNLRGHAVIMQSCHDMRKPVKRQQWSYEKNQLKHVKSNLCLTASASAGAGADARARPCARAPDQLWDIDYTADNDFKRENTDYPGDYPIDFELSAERQERFKKLRGHRRISRSLLSIDDSRAELRARNASAHRRSHRKKHKKRSHKRKNKNKFILRIERTAAPSTGPHGSPAMEHLEVDIRCPHRKLYPNDTFVRDLVSVLNMHDIRVINNGRVFEKNHVSQLPRAEKREKSVKSVVMAPTGDQVQRQPNIVQSIPASEALRQSKRNRLRKHKRPPLAPQQRPSPPERPAAPQQAPPAPPMLPPAMVTPGGAPARNKIIVEDFAEMGTTEVNPKMQQQLDVNEWHKLYPAKRYHLRKRNKHARAPGVPQSARDALLALLGEKIEKATRGSDTSKESNRSYPRHAVSSAPPDQSSPEDVPIQLAPSSVETWNTVNRNDSRREMPSSSSDERSQKQAQKQAQKLVKIYHARDTTSQELDNEVRELHGDRRTQTASSDDEERRPAQPSEEDDSGERHKRRKPVKVTMRNNFTFNIGDEFFSWRSNNDDVADILGELAIPSNSSPAAPPIEAWVKPATDAPLALADLRHDRPEVSSSSVEDNNLKLLTAHGLSSPSEGDSSSKSDSSGE